MVSPMWLSQKFLHDFPDVKVKIFNVFSGAGQRPIAGWAAYCSTKAALKMSAQTLHEEIPLCKRTKPCGIFVYDPGVIDTQMQAEIRGLQKDEFPSASYFSDLAEQGKLRKPDDVAVEIIKLCNGKIERDFYLEDRIRS